MEKKSQSLFDTKADKLTFPTTMVTEEYEDEIVEEDIAEHSSKEIDEMLKPDEMNRAENVIDAISGDTVKSIIIDEVYGIQTPNYTLDISEIEEMTRTAFAAIRSLLSDTGDTFLYLKKDSTLSLIGMCRSEVLYRVLSPAIKNMFGSKCHIYKDFDATKEVKHVTETDVSAIRLDL